MKPAFWLWPLPGPGLLRIACEWPVAGIALREVPVETAPIREAAAKVVQLWGGEPTAGGGWITATAQYAAAARDDAGGTVEVPVSELRALEQAVRRLRRRRGDEE
jgi:hypothetical protein